MNKTLKKILKPILLPLYRWLTKDRLWLRQFLSVVVPVYATKRLYKRTFSKELNLKNPKSLNEKALWLKLNTYYNNPLITECVDKYLVRNYVKRAGCGEIVNELLGVWDKAEKINFDELPDRFVLKGNHGCGYNLIVPDKSKLNIDEARKTVNKWMKEDYWKLFAETQYKFINKKIIAEKFLENKNNPEKWIEDYKFFCINGIPHCVMICTERETGDPKFYYFDRDLNYHPEYYHVPGINELPPPPTKLVFPENLDLMFEYAEKLSKPFPFVRVDLYNIEGKIVFGELTFLSSGGLEHEGYAMRYSAVDITKKIDEKYYAK
ncbi:MAG: ATP-grasp fold amidoligase family protein [Treponemataceae bacterium]